MHYSRKIHHKKKYLSTKPNSGMEKLVFNIMTAVECFSSSACFVSQSFLNFIA